MEFWKRQFSRITFLMAFPGIVIFFNISIYFFIGLFYYANNNLKAYSRKIPGGILIWSILFMVGSAISIFNMPDELFNSNFTSSLRVLPNYVYWALMILFFVKYRNLVDYSDFQKAVFWGITIYIPFWFIRENFLPGVPIVQKTSQNNLAFLMICYGSISLSYIKENKGKLWKWIYFIGILLLMLFLQRRAGFLLVFITGVLTIFVKRITIKYFFSYAMIIVIIFLILKIPITEKFIQGASIEIHQIIYKTGDMRKYDRSYLVRVAMWEKAVYLFKEHPFSGVGLTNFYKSKSKIDGNFEGSEYVLKKDIDHLSAHNSYAAVLAEGGLILFIPWVMILFTVVLGFLKNINHINPKSYPLFYSFIAMIIHYSAITAYVNVYSWFIIAISAVVLAQTQDQKREFKGWISNNFK